MLAGGRGDNPSEASYCSNSGGGATQLGMTCTPLGATCWSQEAPLDATLKVLAPAWKTT